MVTPTVVAALPDAATEAGSRAGGGAVTSVLAVVGVGAGVPQPHDTTAAVSVSVAHAKPEVAKRWAFAVTVHPFGELSA